MTLQLQARPTPPPDGPRPIIATLNGMMVAFCTPLCARRYRAGQPAITVHHGASNGCWLCGRDLTEGSMRL